jgi:hypothetical protein
VVKLPPKGVLFEEPITTCCQAHVSWAELETHLHRDFDMAVDGALVRDEMARACEALTLFGIQSEEERLFIGERIVRHHLEILSGQRQLASRLDPERHSHRKTPVSRR